MSIQMTRSSRTPCKRAKEVGKCTWNLQCRVKRTRTREVGTITSKEKSPARATRKRETSYVCTVEAPRIHEKAHQRDSDHSAERAVTSMSRYSSAQPSSPALSQKPRPSMGEKKSQFGGQSSRHHKKAKQFIFDACGLMLFEKLGARTDVPKRQMLLFW